MFSLNDFLLGGVVPLAAAMIGFAVAWGAARREGVAWSTGVVLGFAAGATALETRGISFGAAATLLVKPHESHEWLPLLSLVAVVPAMAGAAFGRFRGLRWVLSLAIVGAAPLWLLWGGKYLPSQQVRDTGFVPDAWSLGDAMLIVGLLTLAALTAWVLWEAATPDDSPRVRSLLAAVAIVAMAATAGLTHSIVYAQIFGCLAAAIGGAAAAGWILGVKAGPEAADGPVLIVAGASMMLAVLYSDMRAVQAAGLWLALTFAVGWLPGITRLKPIASLALRCALCLIPIGLVLWQANIDHAEMQRQQQQAAESNPYLNL